MSIPQSITSSHLNKLKEIRHLALDMDGTIYLGAQLFPKTLPFLKTLNALALSYTFLTNNSSRSQEDYLRKLEKMGIQSTPSQVLTSTLATIDFLKAEMPKVKRLFILGTPSIQSEFGRYGFYSVEDDPEAVVVGFDMTLVYDRLCRAAWWISQGKPFISIHPDLVCPTNLSTILVDCGAICKMLESVTGVAPLIIGKPNPRILSPILERFHLSPSQLAMVGDRLSTDVEVARRAGAVSILVLSGEATQSDVEKLPLEDRPDIVVEDIGELGLLLREAYNVENYEQE